MKYEPHIAYSEGSKPLTLFKKEYKLYNNSNRTILIF